MSKTDEIRFHTYQRLSQIQLRHFHQFFNHFGYASYDGDDFGQFFNRSPYQFCALLHQEQIIGAILFSQVADETEIIEIAIDSSWQGKGRGSQLLSAFISHMKAQAQRRLILEVARDNEAALALYNKHGFASCGERSGYYQRITGENMRKIDAIIMELWLCKV